MCRLQRTRDDTAGPRAHSRGSLAGRGVVQLLRSENWSTPDDCRPQACHCCAQALCALTCRGWSQGVWRYGQADWERLHDSLADTCWDHIADQSTTAAAKWITDTIHRSASSCIPLSTLRTKKSSHPRLNDRSIALVDAKRTAKGTPFEKEATLACSAGLAAACHYTARTAQKMRCIKPSSKLWWKKAKEVMTHEAQVSRKPAL